MIRVPEGLNDRSQAIYCLEHVESRNRPVGYGMILADRLPIVPVVTRVSDRIIPSLRDGSRFFTDTRQ